METAQSLQERFKRGSADAGRYFDYMAEFVGFGEEDRQTIRETRFIVEKHIPAIIARFYAQLLRYPATRQFFLKKDGSVDQEYLQLRIHHQINFWRRTAAADFDEDYARFTDYVGRAHTSQGADQKIYIPARYVTGMVGFVQSNLVAALQQELAEHDPDLLGRGIKAWSGLLNVLLQMLSRAYGQDHLGEGYTQPGAVDDDAMLGLSVETYERGLGMARSVQMKTIIAGRVEEIPDGQRKIIQADGLSIGVFHHKGKWIALQNSCLHRGGPVCQGPLDGETITCPWHGYQYNLTDGRLLLDKSARLPMYDVEVIDGMIQVKVPVLQRDPFEFSMEFSQTPAPASSNAVTLAGNQFLASQIAPGQVHLLKLDGKRIAVYNVDGKFYATQEECTHMGGPLSEGELKNAQITCPWHAACFDVRDGSVQCGPARKNLQTYRVVVRDGIGQVLNPFE